MQKDIVNQKILFCLVIIFLIGFSFRIMNLSDENIWYDESYTILSLKQSDLISTINSVEKNELFNPPMYYIMMYFWTRLFGFSEFSLRFVSVIFGSFSIIAIYLLTKELFNRKTAILSAFILGFSTLQISFSQETRYYSFFIFLTLLSFYLFLRLIKEPKKIYLLGYIITTVLSVYTLVLAFFSILLQNLIFFFIYYPNKPNRIRFWLIHQFCILLLLLPGLKWFILSTYFNLNEGLSLFVYRYGLPYFMKFVTITILIIIGVISLLLIYRQYKIKSMKFKNILKNLSINNKLFVVILLIILVFEIFVTPLVWRSFFFVRYTVFLYFILYIFLAANLAKLRRTGLIFFILLLILVNVSLTSVYYNKTIKTPWSEVSSFIERNSNNKDIILFGGGRYAFDYYYSGNLTEIEFFPVDNYFTTYDEAKNKITNSLIENPSANGFWFITFRQWLSQPYINYLDSEFKPIFKKDFLDASVYYYKLKGVSND